MEQKRKHTKETEPIYSRRDLKILFGLACFFWFFSFIFGLIIGMILQGIIT